MRIRSRAFVRMDYWCIARIDRTAAQGDTTLTAMPTTARLPRFRGNPPGRIQPDARYAPAAAQEHFSRDLARAAGHAAGQPRLQMQPDLRALSRQCRAESHGDDGPRYGRTGPAVPAGIAGAYRRH